MPGRIETVKSGAVIFFRSSSTITSLAICRRLAAQSCSRSSRSCISAMRPLGPVARASSASARRIALYVNTKSINSPTKSSSLIGWSQELAAAASISLPTIKRLEAVEGPLGGRKTTVEKIRVALERAGIEFIDENGGGAGVRLRKRQRQKK